MHENASPYQGGLLSGVDLFRQPAAPPAATNAPEMRIRCLVLDLDNTLIQTEGEGHYTDVFIMGTMNPNLKDRIYTLHIDDVRSHAGDGWHGEGKRDIYWGVERPHVKEFLRWCFLNFTYVGVWSAGQKPYVKAVCSAIFKGPGIGSPHFIWTADEVDYQPPPQARLKDLNKLFNAPIGRMLGLNITNTVLVDDRDSSYNATVHNGILIPAYEPKYTVEGLDVKDDALLKLGYWFATSGFFFSPDVRSLDKSSIFN